MSIEIGEILDFEALLAPIPGENTAGQNLRYEAVFDEIKNYREEDDPNLPQGVWETDLKVADWKAVKKRCVEVLSQESKDLQLAVWLLEALINEDGFFGVVDGIALILQLCQKFWDNIYPELEDDGCEFRVSPMAWVNSNLSKKIKTISFTQPLKSEFLPYSYQDWDKVIYLEKLAKQSVAAKEELKKEKKFTQSLFKRSVENTSPQFYEDLRNYLTESLNQTKELERFLDDKCGKQSPSLTEFYQVLKKIFDQVSSFSKRVGKAAEEEIIKEKDSESASSLKTLQSMKATFSVGSEIKGREEAYRLLEELADYFLELDPHSPVPYLLKRAVAWGEMTFSQLLADLLKDGHNLKQVYSLLGIGISE